MPSGTCQYSSHIFRPHSVQTPLEADAGPAVMGPGKCDCPCANLACCLGSTSPIQIGDTLQQRADRRPQSGHRQNRWSCLWWHGGPIGLQSYSATGPQMSCGAWVLTLDSSISIWPFVFVHLAKAFRFWPYRSRWPGDHLNALL